jgi:hypothetical protein
MRGVPQRLEQDVGEAQRQQVLDGLLAEVMVDPEDPVLGKGGGNRVVDVPARFEIRAERLFQAHAHRVAGEAGLLEPADRRLEQARRCREEDREALFGRADLLRQRGKAVFLRRVERLVVQPVEESRDAAAAVGGQEFFERLAGEVAEALVVVVGPGGAYDLELLREQVVVVERA